MIKLGLTQCKIQPCLFFSNNLIIWVHVDDVVVVVVVAGEEDTIVTFKIGLKSHINIKEMDMFILGLEIEQSQGQVKLNQTHDTQQVLIKFKM